jgi:hypothetical protein
MDTQVRTPQTVFTQPQRLVVPLFQRPYVWNEENQWEPLWNDVVRVAERLLSEPRAKHSPHFLGAVVLQQLQSATGLMQERTIIDGQQRLTTLQLLLDALHAELLAADATTPALRIEPLVSNAEPFRTHQEDRFKVWPTNRDRPAFNAVMGAEPPVDYDALGHSGERMVDAHRYFGTQAREWLGLNGREEIGPRAVAIETATRDLLQMVVIDLAADENAQEIFETLNARGAPLTAADLIKNFVFQRLQEAGADVERAYERYWKQFETAFWEADVYVGRLRYPRSSIFLNHWLVAMTGEEVVAREVFSRFKRFALFDDGGPMVGLLQELDRAADVYHDFIGRSGAPTGPIDRLGLFGYRTGVLESEVIKPLVLYLLDPSQPAVLQDQLDKALDVVESWMVRRMLVRATTKSYTQIIAELITLLRKSDRARAGDAIEAYFVGQTSTSRYWPDDDEIRTELKTLSAYRRLRRSRLRMILEAVEDHLRGWRDGKVPLSEERVMRGKLHIEHVMPRKWELHWPHPDGQRGASDRDRLIDTIGNLTLLTGRLNAKVSNGPWLGEGGKRHGLETHDVLMLNRRLVDVAKDSWTDAAIRKRSDELATLITQIWPVPEGHHSGFAHEKAPVRHRVDLLDLISAGWLEPGTVLVPRRRTLMQVEATLLPDGRIDVAGGVYVSPSEAATVVTGRKTSGWKFFLVDKHTRRSLRDVRREYLESFAEDVGEDEGDDDSDEDEEDGASSQSQ